MKQQFITKKFNEEAQAIIDQAEAICVEYAAQGYDLSLRQLYYQFVSRDLLANLDANYKKLGGIISDARLAGLIDWDRIKDRGRAVEENGHWSSPSQILNVCADQFRIDTWALQPNYVLVMVEKQALEGVLVPTCKKLDVPFIANKGYSSSSTMYEIGRTLHHWVKYNRDPHVIYLGDHDPSGIDMTRDVLDRLTMFAEAPVHVHRIALNYDQVQEYQPPENPAKLSDTRAKKYIEKYGDSSWELDALEPRVLASLVETKVLSLRDERIYAAAQEKEQGQKDQLAQLAGEFDRGER